MLRSMQKGIVCAAAMLAVAASSTAQPAITEDPQDRTAVPGATVYFRVLAQGTGTLRYQWQFNGQDLPNARTKVLRLLATPTRAGSYSVRVFDDGGERSSGPARLEVVLRPRVVQQPRNTVVGVHGTATFETLLNESGPYWRMIWHNSNPLEGSHEIPEGLGFEVDQPTLTIPNCLDTDSYNGLYWLAATNAAAGTTSRRARLTVVGPPVFSRTPPDKVVRWGGTASFTVQLVPDAALQKTFQWYKDGKPIAGATTKRYTIVNAQPADAGNYYCTATSIGGSASSWGAQLTVIDSTVSQ